MAFTNERPARFARIRQIRRVHHRNSTLTHPLRDLLNADFGLFGQLLNIHASIFAQMFGAALVVLLQLLITIIANLSEALREQLSAFRTVG